MGAEEDAQDQRLMLEVRQITQEYGALHRRTVRDLTYTRRELDEANRVLGTVAHDLRSPIAAVLGFVELLLEDGGLTPHQRDLGERTQHAARRMSTLTDELVEALTLGASSLASDPVDLSRVVDEVVIRHQLLQPPRGIRVMVDRGRPSRIAAVIHGDPSKLERVLDNLVSNAVKFSPDDGRVSVSLAVDGRWAILRVSDDGPGLPADELEAIFLPFHRAPGARSVSGVGLGLTIVRQLAERHGGHVHAESVPGAGATFVVSLPIAVSGRAAEGPQVTT